MKKMMIAAAVSLLMATPSYACVDGLLHDGDAHFAGFPMCHFSQYVAEKRLVEERAEQEARERTERILEAMEVDEECASHPECDECSVPVDYLGEFEVTYYCDKGLTKTGTHTEIGICGVDPNVIPLGSTIYIEYEDGSIRECKAEDTGSAVIGNIIDVWLPDEATCWELGRDVCKVYLEEEE